MNDRLARYLAQPDDAVAVAVTPDEIRCLIMATLYAPDADRLRAWRARQTLLWAVDREIRLGRLDRADWVRWMPEQVFREFENLGCRSRPR